MSSCNPPGPVIQWFSVRGVRHKRKYGRFAEEKKLATPLSRRKTATRLHRADTCTQSRTGASAEPLLTRQLSALFRLRTMTDSPALPTAPFRYTNPPRRLRGAFRCIPTVANCQDSQEQLVRFPKTKTARLAARLRPAKISNSPRVSARGQDTGSNTARGSACRRRRAIAVSTGFACSDFTLVPRV